VIAHLLAALLGRQRIDVRIEVLPAILSVEDVLELVGQREAAVLS
jgi:hypothetical protein